MMTEGAEAVFWSGTSIRLVKGTSKKIVSQHLEYGEREKIVRRTSRISSIIDLTTLLRGSSGETSGASLMRHYQEVAVKTE